MPSGPEDRPKPATGCHEVPFRRWIGGDSAENLPLRLENLPLRLENLPLRETVARIPASWPVAPRSAAAYTWNPESISSASLSLTRARSDPTRLRLGPTRTERIEPDWTGLDWTGPDRTGPGQVESLTYCRSGLDPVRPSWAGFLPASDSGPVSPRQTPLRPESLPLRPGSLPLRPGSLPSGAVGRRFAGAGRASRPDGPSVGRIGPVCGAGPSAFFPRFFHKR